MSSEAALVNSLAIATAIWENKQSYQDHQDHQDHRENTSLANATEI